MPLSGGRGRTAGGRAARLSALATLACALAGTVHGGSAGGARRLQAVVASGPGGPGRLSELPAGDPAVALEVSRIEDDGYLRLAPAGGGAPGGGASRDGGHRERSYEGRLLWVAGERGAVPGTVAAPSVHLARGAGAADRPFSLAGAFLDVGAESAAEVAELGVRLHDPVTLDRSLPGTGAAAARPPRRGSPPLAPDGRHAETAARIAPLAACAGVSGDEAAVREAVLRELPLWAHPLIDRLGNLSVTFGAGAEAAAPAAAAARAAESASPLFIAHLDEVGFQVSEVLADGRLALRPRGGLLPSLWQARAALVAGRRGPVPAVIEPSTAAKAIAGRQAAAGAAAGRGAIGKAAATGGTAGDPLTAVVAAAGPEEIATLGIRAGSTVTLPKRLLRLGRHRVASGALDDRAGAAVLLLALRRIDPARLRRPVTFAWTTREEIGFLGAAALARAFPGPRRVYPVDAYDSPDSPREARRAAAVALGRGAIVGAFDAGPYAPRPLADRVLALGRRRGIALQLATLAQPGDGIPFLGGSATVLPLSFPCRYTHSPAEVADLRDLESLVDLVVTLAADEP
jgi:putative aminopeptidase FrvX